MIYIFFICLCFCYLFAGGIRTVFSHSIVSPLSCERCECEKESEGRPYIRENEVSLN